MQGNDEAHDSTGQHDTTQNNEQVRLPLVSEPQAVEHPVD